MADPTKYTPKFNYSGWEAAGNKRPKPGAELDIDFANIARSIDETIDALKDIRRSDGKLKNGIVDMDAMEPGLKAEFQGYIDEAEQARDDARAARSGAQAAQSGAETARAGAETARDIARGYASDAVSQGNVPIYASVATVEGLNIPPGITAIRTNGYNTPGDGGGALYKRVSSEPSHAGKIQSADGAWWEDVGYNTITVRIPSDFDTLQEAVDHYSRLPIRQGAKVRLLIESGHAITHGLYLQDGQYGHFTIESEDEVVELAPDFQAVDVTHLPGLSTAPKAALCFVNCHAPVRMALFDGMWHDIYGIIYTQGAIGYASNGAGFMKTTCNMEVRQGFHWCAGNDFSESKDRAVHITRSSVVDVSTCRLDDACQDFAGISRGALDVSRGSFVYARGIRIRDSVSMGIYARRSTVHAQDCTIERSGRFGVGASLGATVIVNDGRVTESGENDLSIFGQGGMIHANGTQYNTTVHPPNVFGPRGYIIDRTVTHGTGTDRPFYAGNIDEIYGDKDEGYYIRSDGWASTWIKTQIDADSEDVQAFSMPLSIPDGAVTISGDSRTTITSGSGLSNRGRTFAALAYDLSSGGGTVRVRISGEEQTQSGPLDVMIYVSGYIKEPPQ